MIGLFMKLMLSPAVLLLADILFPNVYFRSFYHPILIGITLALVGYILELFILREDTIWKSTLLDFGMAVFVIYYGTFWFVNAQMTWFGAILTAVLFAISEHIQHHWFNHQQAETSAG